MVLLPQFRETEEEGQWTGLRHAVAGALRQQLASDGQVVLYDAMRTLSWPHAGLYWNDLYGIPTLIVQVTSYRDTLDVGLGGCQLRPRADAPGEALRSVYQYQSPRDDYWTGEVLAELNASAFSGCRFAVPETDADRARLGIEVAARAVTAVTAAAVDVYYLGIRARYRQRFDHAEAMLGRGALQDWRPTWASPSSRWPIRRFTCCISPGASWIGICSRKRCVRCASRWRRSYIPTTHCSTGRILP